ncbi:MAG: hypothetical protein ACOYNS_02680 [Bacteroidota bacterium]
MLPWVKRAAYILYYRIISYSKYLSKFNDLIKTVLLAGSGLHRYYVPAHQSIVHRLTIRRHSAVVILFSIADQFRPKTFTKEQEFSHSMNFSFISDHLYRMDTLHPSHRSMILVPLVLY